MSSNPKDTHRVCGFRPFPGNGAYGHWTCERPRFHFGQHRFRNYTIARVPRIWLLRQLIRDCRRDRRNYRRVGKPGLGYRGTLYPTRYTPTTPRDL